MQRGVKNLNRPTKPNDMSKSKTNKTAKRSHVAHQRLVSQPVLTSPEVVKEIIFLFGYDQVPKAKYDKAVNLVRAIWRDGYSVGAAMQKKKPATMKRIKAIIYGKGVANDRTLRPAK